MNVPHASTTDAHENRYCATCRRTEKFTRRVTTEECRVCGRVLLIVSIDVRGVAR